MKEYKRIAAIFLSVILLILSAYGHPVSAGDDSRDTTLNITVPNTHTVSIEVSGNGAISVLGNTYKQNTDISADRLKEVSYTVIPDAGYEIGSVTYGGVDVTGQIEGNSYTAPALVHDDSIRAVFNKMRTDCSVSPQSNSNGYYTDDVMIKPPEGYKISFDRDGDWADSLTINNSTDVVVYLRSPAGGISDSIALGKISIDRTAPVTSGDKNGIIIEDHAWKSFINTITFGLIYNKTKTAVITAEDPESGIDSYSYYISDKALSIEQVKGITSWQNGDKFDISGDDADNKIIYAKITNKAGLVLYISSDGMIFDTVAPKISGAVNGEAYYNDEPVDITVTDAELAGVTVNGKDIVIKDNKAEFTVNTDDDNDDDYTITAKDKAGNVSSVAFSIYETWAKEGINRSGSYKFKKNKKYKLGDGTWSVSGDNCIYNGNMYFYVKEKNMYTLTKHE